MGEDWEADTCVYLQEKGPGAEVFTEEDFVRL